MVRCVARPCRRTLHAAGDVHSFPPPGDLRLHPRRARLPAGQTHPRPLGPPHPLAPPRCATTSCPPCACAAPAPSRSPSSAPTCTSASSRHGCPPCSRRCPCAARLPWSCASAAQGMGWGVFVLFFLWGKGLPDLPGVALPRPWVAHSCRPARLLRHPAACPPAEGLWAQRGERPAGVHGRYAAVHTVSEAVGPGHAARPHLCVLARLPTSPSRAHLPGYPWLNPRRTPTPPHPGFPGTGGRAAGLSTA